MTHRLNPPPAIHAINALFVGDSGPDYSHLCSIFKMMDWRLIRVPSLRIALRRASETAITHVLFEHRRGSANGWIEALDAIHALPCSPQFILTSRLGDERLWADVLSRGGYDLLIQPYESLEVTRVVIAAHEHARRRSAPAAAMAS